MVKVLFISNEYPTHKTAGAGVYSWNFSKELAKLGNKVYVLTWGLLDVENVENLTVHRFRLNKILPIIIHKLVFLFTLPLIVFKANKIAGKFDVIHIADASFSSLITFVTCRLSLALTKIPLVITAHHLYYEEFLIRDKKRSLFKRVYKNIFEFLAIVSEFLSLKYATAIINVSNYTQKSLNRVYGIPYAKMYVVLNGISNLKKVNQRQFVFEKNNKNIILLSIGKNTPRKGYNTLLKAYEKIRLDYPNVKLVLVGGETSNLVRSDEFSHVKEGIETFEHVDERMLSALYEYCDIYVSSAVLEGFGLTILEAMAAGKAVVATESGGVCDFFENGANGLLVKPNNWQQLSEAIMYLIQNESLRKRIGDSNKTYAMTKFTWKNSAEQAYKVYLQLIQANFIKRRDAD